MSQATPTGTRDVLPEEMAELREIEATVARVFADRGYGEVATPIIEYSDVLDRADRGAPALRFFDERGDALAMRSDMTVPIARMAATRLAERDGPFRFRYQGSAFRPIDAPGGQAREFRQVGIELIGAEPPDGTIEVIELLVRALDALGLDDAVIGLGDSDLFSQLLDEMGVEEAPRERILGRLMAHDLVAIEAEAGDLAGIGEAERAAIVTLSNLRGGAEVLEHARSIGGDAVDRASSRLAETYAGLERAGVADRVQLDLGLLRDLRYYTGAILEVYDPALGYILGGGGRYDDLLGRFGRARPAAGFALYLERVHVAQAAQRRAT